MGREQVRKVFRKVAECRSKLNPSKTKLYTIADERTMRESTNDRDDKTYQSAVAISDSSYSEAVHQTQGQISKKK
jgi:hypothetical protein